MALIELSILVYLIERIGGSMITHYIRVTVLTFFVFNRNEYRFDNSIPRFLLRKSQQNAISCKKFLLNKEFFVKMYG